MHFYVEHNRGHHVRVAAPKIRQVPDSASHSGDSCLAAL